MKVRTDFSLPDYLERQARRVDDALSSYFSEENGLYGTICEAVRYSLLSGGKRIRPVLCMAAAEAVGARSEDVLPAACALEMIHAYSLIHDDLPAMDNDDYRRGRLTSHKVFGEDMAVLAGDALLTEAFCVLTDRGKMPDVPPERILTVAGEIALAAGYRGMVGGQALDVRAEGKEGDLDNLYAIHRHKTGALLRISLRTGAILADADEDALASLTAYGEKIGLAFQIADDILNVEGDSTLMGKQTGSDAERGKATFPGLIGIEASRRTAKTLVAEAISMLDRFDDRAEPLRAIAHYILNRKS
jgi:geranylgeranyl diphosphate synthase type II